MRIEAEEYVKNYKLLWDIVEEMTLLNFELLKSKKPQPEKCESPVKDKGLFAVQGAICNEIALSNMSPAAEEI